MKRAERHHLKENELASLTSSARHALEENRTPVTAIAIGVIVVLIAAGGYYAWTSRVNAGANALLADAMLVESAPIMPPPAPGQPGAGMTTFLTQRAKDQAQLTKFKIVADEYPSTDAGVFARYRMGTTYLSLGEAKSAAETFQAVIDEAGANSLYGQLSRLGLAEAQAQSGSYDQAIATFTEFSQNREGAVPVDGVLSRLARVYIEAGKPADAQRTLTRLVDEFPNSPFTADARRTLEEMKKG
jgi:predicted negative regulator of RcsB-dependent stress response